MIYPAATRPEEINQIETVMPPTQQISTQPTENQGMEQENVTKSGSKDAWDPLVPLDHLFPVHQQEVKQLLREESNAFAWDEYDVGTIPSLQLKIHLNDPR